MEDQPENIRTNKGLVRVYLTMFWIALSTIILSIISSEHKESITLFKQYQTTDVQLLSPNQQFEIISRLPIKEPRFVEGLEFISQNELLMSSGEYGSSYVDLIDITELPLMPKLSHALDSDYFGEGITFLDDAEEILMMTYRAHKAFRFSKDLELLQELTMPREIREGWGMTHIGKQLVVSDGTDRIFFVDPENFEIENSVQVREGTKVIRKINELEYVDGSIYANVFQENDIIKLDLDGQVLSRFDMSSLLEIEKAYLDEHNITWQRYDVLNNVLNGIAYHKESDTFFVTGKNWHFLFQIRFI